MGCLSSGRWPHVHIGTLIELKGYKKNKRIGMWEDFGGSGKKDTLHICTKLSRIKEFKRGGGHRTLDIALFQG